MKSKLPHRIVIVAAIAGLIVLFWVYNLGDYLTLPYLKESRNRFELILSGHRFEAIAGYAAIYILVAVLSLPGAVIMTIAGGALFGLLRGTVIVSFASSIGATLACLVSRFLLRDWVQEKFGKRLETINDGVQKEGAFYLFTLRLIPVFPFWLINLLMGLTKMPLKTFYLISQIGMLPGTIVYVNAGTELAKINSVYGILSPTLLASLILLGLFPITAKKLLSLYRSARSRRGDTV